MEVEMGRDLYSAIAQPHFCLLLFAISVAMPSPTIPLSNKDNAVNRNTVKHGLRPSTHQ